MAITLSASVRKLGEGAMEQTIMFPKRLLRLFNVRLLHSHIFICDFRYFRDEKHTSQAEDEYAYGEINPLNTLQCLYIIIRLGEEGIRAQHRAEYRSDGIERLCEIDTDLSVFGRTAD